MPGEQEHRDWPFLGREAELDLLIAGLATGPSKMESSGPMGGAVIVASAGVGKTRLLREALAAAEDRQVPTALVIATRSARTTPYAALIHLAPGGSLGGHPDIASWYHAFATALRPPGAPRPVVGVDDAHLLDPGSAALLLHLVLTGTASVLATVRRGEPSPDPVTAMWKDGLVSRIDLQPMSSGEIGRLLEAAVGEVSAHTRDKLAEFSDGNVLYLKELVHAAIDGGSMRLSDGLWRWNGEVVLAPRLVEAVAARIGGLTDAERRGLGLVALAEPLPLARAEVLVEADVLDRLESAGLVRADPAPAPDLRLGHPLYGEVVLAALGRRVKTQLLRALVTAFRGQDRPETADVVRVATWQLELGAPPDVALLAAAAELANRAFDHSLAERLATAALAGGAGPAAAVALARAHNRQNRFENAEGVLAAVESDLLALDDTDLDQRYLDQRHAALYMGLGRRDATIGVLERFVHARPGTDRRGRLARSLAVGYRAQVELDDGRLDVVSDLTRPVLDDPDAAGPLALLLSLETAAEALAYLGRTAEARGLHQRLLALGESGEPLVARAASSAVLQECLCLEMEGRAGDALALFDSIRQVTAMNPDPHVRALTNLVLGVELLRSGRPESARRVLRDAVAEFREGDSGGAGGWALSLLCQAEMMLGDGSAARSALEESERLRLPRPIARMVADFARARAWVSAADGDLTGARQGLIDAAATLGGLDLPRLGLLHLAGCWGAAPRALADEAAAIAERSESTLPALAADHLGALADDDGAALGVVAGRFDELGQCLQAAEAAAQASRSHARAGLRGAAVREAARSARWREGCEGATSPVFSDTPVALPSLSSREEDVARLAARGLSNAAIAERLVLSVRTVESHLYRVFAKFGVRRRDDLAEVFDETVEAGQDVLVSENQ